MRGGDALRNAVSMDQFLLPKSVCYEDGMEQQRERSAGSANGVGAFLKCEAIKSASPAHGGARWCYRTGPSGGTGQSAFDDREHFVE
jgi:hypothetical protein